MLICKAWRLIVGIQQKSVRRIPSYPILASRSHLRWWPVNYLILCTARIHYVVNIGYWVFLLKTSVFNLLVLAELTMRKLWHLLVGSIVLVLFTVGVMLEPNRSQLQAGLQLSLYLSLIGRYAWQGAFPQVWPLLDWLKLVKKNGEVYWHSTNRKLRKKSSTCLIILFNQQKLLFLVLMFYLLILQGG